MNKHKDLAEKSHWDMLYSNITLNQQVKWYPQDYCSVCIGKYLEEGIGLAKGKKILEIGCGNSTWLPFLSDKFELEATGIDYSEHGCRLVEERLSSYGLNGKIYCRDVFTLNPDVFGKYDLIYSLGVVEHFTDLDKVIRTFATFVKPGGILLTSVPNMNYWSIHWWLSWFWHPELLSKHHSTTKQKLIRSYKKAGLEVKKARHIGFFSMDIVAWEHYQRFPKIMNKWVPGIRCFIKRSDNYQIRKGWFRGNFFFSPFIYVIGSVPEKTDKS